MERDTARVLDDYLDGFVSLEAARDSYGVVIEPEAAEVDSKATHALRASIRDSRGNTKMFHRFNYFNTESEEYEWITQNISRGSP